jgi:plasmid stability protein
MGVMQVKNVPEELRMAARQRAAEEGLTVSEYVLALIRRDLAIPSQRRWLATLSTREPTDRADVLGALDAVRRERDESLAGR